MSQCLKVSFEWDVPHDLLQDIIVKHARALRLEGTGQAADKRVRIIICGERDAIDNFIDVLHKELSKKVAPDLEMEPFLKEKDYRGVFRVIE